ncbi:chromatin assembly factor 1 subunit A, putative [Talaromyces stipitatus ATCC 10500]|uniref:Chromatin assembly factor 1 subunit A, putative n=1 Tax=Talaromyces stipitatus (strain ATCC 10500 / CBS 375.48 / QM 6759 / NRRL 1006) TaxID=441959 RepID=B8M9J1_TALSN|nr:chromatin assembly factor 1 subunit A, putative [Talaromyces stipitatus ATCC 10500]EED17993.1 chromatin assembly factor 1 subunit A, putative [Talaromyces stipitatus ATCC 10500]
MDLQHPLNQHLPMSSPTSPQNRKRTFNEVEGGHNILNPDTIKPQRHGDDEQENQNPLQYVNAIDIDKVPLTAANMTETQATQIPANAPNPPSNGTFTLTTPTVPSTPPQPQQHATTSSNTANFVNKKLKLSPGSKEAKRKEKEERDRLRAEEKAKKEAEKKAKEEERKKKEAEKEEERKKRETEREEKKKQKEEERQAKEEGKRKKEEEREKKERSQMRLKAFFSKPSGTAAERTSLVPSSPRKDTMQEYMIVESAVKSHNPPQSDYRKEFPVFFLQSHTHLSPPHQFQRDSEALAHIQQKLDGYLKEPTALPAYRGSELFNMIPYRRRKGLNVVSVKSLLAKAQDMDLTPSTTALRDELKKVTMKSLKFGEDVRPPYYGTFTRPLSKAQARKVSRAPYSRVLPEVNYDYDSEVEWEEPEEGEDLDSEGEEDASDDGDDDMDGFLDDEDEQLDSRRRLIVGDQEPVCTGVRWEDGGNADPDMEVYRIEALSETIRFPINPFSTAYWPKPKVVEHVAPKVSSSLPPVRATLHAYAINPSTSTYTPSPLAPPTVPSATLDNSTTSKAKKPFPPEHIEEFKQTVEGCDLTKAGLIEVLKKRFPKVSKDTLKDTVNAVAVRVGQKEADKKWTCK